MAELLADGYEVALKFLAPAGLRFSVQSEGARVVGAFWAARAASPRAGGIVGPATSSVACGRILRWPCRSRISRRREARRCRSSSPFTTASNREPNAIPVHRPIDVGPADELFEARNWRA